MTKKNMSKTNKFLVIILVVFALMSFWQVRQKRTRPESNSDSGVPSRVNASLPRMTRKENPNLNSQENEGGNVTVTVKPKTLKVGESPVFELEFETHSVDLDFDVTEQSYLVDDKGKRFNNGIWEGSPPGGHHREGTLVFDTPLTQTSYVEFIIKDISGVAERKFKWNL